MKLRKVLKTGEYVVDPSSYNWKSIIRKSGIVKHREGNPGRALGFNYIDLVCAFDIETAPVVAEQASMYVWMLQLGLDSPTIVGRTWEEFQEVLEDIRGMLAGRRKRLVIWVHNLSYEFQFLRTIYDFSNEEVFAVRKRKVLKCTMFDGIIEFRCSYLHSNMSLAEYASKMGVKHLKESGEDFDYSETRYPWTPLTDSQLQYCVHDVLGLVEALTIEMKHDGDTLETIPLTSTGYVRRDAKRAMREVPHAWLSEIQPNYDVYCMLREAFRGGNTHANRWFAGDILENVGSCDESSAYPAAMLTGRYPVSKFEYLGPCNGAKLKDLIKRREKAVLCRVGFYNIRLRDETWGNPYLSIAKIRNAQGVKPDNGRVLEAEYLETTLTDIDLEIVLSEYDFDDVIAEDVYYANYGELPNVLKDLISEYFERKTKLKGVEGQEVYYVKSKNKLNSIYGMSAQDPVKQDVIFNGLDFDDANDDESFLLLESTRKSFFPYQWGVWTTANARLMLEEGLRCVGDRFVYADTDSIKYLRDEAGEIEWSIALLNKSRMNKALDNKAFAEDPSGTVHFMGVFEDEGVYKRFCTLGAKKYAYEDMNGKLSVTVAGVTKKPVKTEFGKMGAGAYELMRHGGLYAFKPGFTFRDAGGTESVYNDTVFGTVEINGHELYIGQNILIRDSTYTLGLTAEYERLLEKCYNLKACGQMPEPTRKEQEQ